MLAPSPMLVLRLAHPNQAKMFVQIFQLQASRLIRDYPPPSNDVISRGAQKCNKLCLKMCVKFVLLHILKAVVADMLMYFDEKLRHTLVLTSDS